MAEIHQQNIYISIFNGETTTTTNNNNNGVLTLIHLEIIEPEPSQMQIPN